MINRDQALMNMRLRRFVETSIKKFTEHFEDWLRLVVEEIEDPAYAEFILRIHKDMFPRFTVVESVQDEDEENIIRELHISIKVPKVPPPDLVEWIKRNTGMSIEPDKKVEVPPEKQ